MFYYKDSEGNLVSVPMKEGADAVDFVKHQATVRFVLAANGYPAPATAMLAVVK